MMAAAADRLPVVDGSRGIAVMGIVLMNVADFALPQAAYLQPQLGGHGIADVAVWAAELVLVDGKFRNLFALLFGASMLIVADRAQAAGRSAAATHCMRMAWLFAFGIAHLYLLWWGDILHHYALVGSAAFLLRRRAPHELIALGIVILAIDLLLLGGVAAALWSLHAAAVAPDATADIVARWHGTAAALRADPADIAREIALYRGGYAGIFEHRLTAQARLPIDTLVIAGPETFAMMLFGMAALRSGFLTGAWSAAAYRRTAIAGYAIGLPIMLALAAWCVHARFDPLVCVTVLFAASLPVRAAIMIAHAALLIPWLVRARGTLVRRVAAAGRMALSNYLLTSLLMTLLFYGYGAGRFATLGRAALLVPVAAMWALMLLWSAPWLDRYAYGPFEWLWRSLARGEIQPLRRRAIANISQ